MEVIVALGVVIAGAALALRSALSEAPYGSPPPRSGDDAVAQDVTVAENVTVADVAAGDGDAPGEETLAMDPLAEEATDPDATLTAVAAVPPVPAMAALPAPEPAAGAIAVAERPPVVLAITEDRALDEVLTAATETTDPPKHPALRLIVAITALGLAFAAAILGFARAVQALFDKYFG